MKVIIAFTNERSLNGININTKISSLPKKIVINDEFHIFLFADHIVNPDLDFIMDTYNEIYLIYHSSGETDKYFVKNKLGKKILGSFDESHIQASGNYYDVQMRKVLVNLDLGALDKDVWKLNDKVAITDTFLLSPFPNLELEKKLTLLHKLLGGDFTLNKNEEVILDKNEFDLTAYKVGFETTPNKDSLRKLRDQFTLDF